MVTRLASDVTSDVSDIATLFDTISTTTLGDEADPLRHEMEVYRFDQRHCLCYAYADRVSEITICLIIKLD